MTDIHCHIMPGVDDGSYSMETSIGMLEMAYNQGIQNIILTPHNKPDRHHVSVEGIMRRTAELQGIAAAAHIPVKLYPGAELLYRSSLADELEQGKACTLAESHYALIEFDPMDAYSYIRNGLTEISGAGFWPILAHAERYAELCRRPERIRELAQVGVYLQVNAGSLEGKYGFAVKRVCWEWMKQELISFVATDAHNLKSRPPQLKKCARMLVNKCGAEYADSVLEENAGNIIRNVRI